jgi:hypothetical protein
MSIDVMSFASARGSNPEPDRLLESFHEDRTGMALRGEPFRAGLRFFATLLARLAADGERQRAEAPLGNLTLACAAGAVLARVEASQGFRDLSERFRAHLQERELETVLAVCVGVFEVVPDVIRSVGTTVAQPTLDVVLQRASPIGQHLPQVRIPSRRVSHVHPQP